jgi:phosphatidylinositol alpha-1,6-mannosyltransferase
VRLRPLWCFLLQAGIASSRAALRFKPQIVLAGSGLTAPAAWLAARICGAKAAVYLHGLDIAVQHRVYRRFWLPFFRHMDGVIVNSRYTAELARASGIAATRISIVHPGVTLPATTPDAAAIAAFRARFDLGASRILLSVGRLTERKGLLEFVAECRQDPDSLLAIAGDNPVDAIGAGYQSPEAVLRAAQSNGIEQHLRFLGRIDDATLEIAYRAAAVHIFPVKDSMDDPEGFGMVAIEAAAHGLPTVAFASGGIADAVADGSSGFLVAPGAYQSFAAKVLAVLADGDPLRETCPLFAAAFTWDKFTAKLGDALEILAAGPP